MMWVMIIGAYLLNFYVIWLHFHPMIDERKKFKIESEKFRWVMKEYGYSDKAINDFLKDYDHSSDVRYAWRNFKKELLAFK